MYMFHPRVALAHDTKGFTFVEFIVIISIFAVMSAIALFNFRGFRSSVGLNNLAYDIALEVKTAQTLGVSAPGADFFGGQQVVTMMFDYSGNSFTNAFLSFREMSGSLLGSFDTGVDMPLRDSNLSGGIITDISICSTSSSCNSLSDAVFISFQRPDPEPVITSASCGGNPPTGYRFSTCHGTLMITLTDPAASSSNYAIYVEPSGQIRVTII